MSDIRKDKLKPCPFCGGDAVQFGTSEMYTTIGENYFSIQCSECLIETTSYEFEKEAIDAWNRRVTNE